MKRRRVDVDLAVAGLLGAAILAVGWFGPDPHPPAAADAATVARDTYQGRDVRWWANHAVQARKDANARKVVIRRLRHARLAQFEPPYEHAATLAAIAYDVNATTLIRKGRCESINWTKFTNTTSHAMGPWQFLSTTWATTPFARFSPYDPIAAALAAAWMHRVGRGSEWSCR